MMTVEKVEESGDGGVKKAMVVEVVRKWLR